MDVIGGRTGTYEGGIAFFLPGHAAGQRAVHLAGGRIVLPAPELGGNFAVELWAWSGTGKGRVLSVGGMAVDAGPAKEWQHIVVVRRGSRVQVFRNGGLDTTGVLEGPAGKEVVLEGWEGKVDELAVYGRALTAVEVSNHWLARR